MCLLVVIRGPDGSLVLAANRDEYFARPTRQPFVWDRTPRILAGRDEKGGGTWLAVNEHGVAAAVTNRATVGRDRADRPTRGNLPLLACACASAGQAWLVLQEHLAATRYNGFNLFVGDRREAFVIQAGDSPPVFDPVAPGRYALGNAAWDDPADPRVARAHLLLSQRPAGPAGTDEIVAALMALCRNHEPMPDGKTLCLHAGPALPGRSPTASPGRGPAGTVSSTIIILGASGRLERYLHAPGPPCRTEYGGLSFGERVNRVR